MKTRKTRLTISVPAPLAGVWRARARAAGRPLSAEVLADLRRVQALRQAVAAARAEAAAARTALAVARREPEAAAALAARVAELTRIHAALAADTLRLRIERDDVLADLREEALGQAVAWMLAARRGDPAILRALLPYAQEAGLFEGEIERRARLKAVALAEDVLAVRRQSGAVREAARTAPMRAMMGKR